MRILWFLQRRGWCISSSGMLPQIPVELVCYYYSTVHQDGSHRRTDTSLTFYIRMVHSPEELISHWRSTSGYFTSQKNWYLTFYMRIVHNLEELVSRCLSTWGWFTSQNWYLAFCMGMVHSPEVLIPFVLRQIASYHRRTNILHEDGAEPRRTGISTFYVRLVYITEELISNILHEDGSPPRRAGVQLTFYIRMLAFAPRMNSDCANIRWERKTALKNVTWRFKLQLYLYWTNWPWGWRHYASPLPP